MVKQGFLNLSKEEQEQVMEAALDEFSQKDYASASINQIIQNAGISKGSMYHYFQNKEDLYMHMLTRVMEEKTKFLQAAVQNAGKPVHELTFFENLAFQMEVGIKFAQEKYRYHMIGFHLQNMPESSLKERVWGRMKVAFDQYMDTMVESAIAAGELRKDLGKEFLLRILGFVVMNFTDIYPDYRTMLQDGDQRMVAEMKKLVDFLKHGLSEPMNEEEKK
jgi:TetR/AcrR family transcriptional regulator